MLLPNRHEAYIPPSKLNGYLLSETHPVGRSRAKFFRSLGYDETNTERLAYGLSTIARTQRVSDVSDSVHGTKYVIEGILETPSGRFINVRTVWITDTGKTAPRFVTAYPA